MKSRRNREKGKLFNSAILVVYFWLILLWKISMWIWLVLLNWIYCKYAIVYLIFLAVFISYSLSHLLDQRKATEILAITILGSTGNFYFDYIASDGTPSCSNNYSLILQWWLFIITYLFLMHTKSQLYLNYYKTQA